MNESALLALLPRLRRYARALTGLRAEADDLVQDTLERAWERAAQFHAGADLRVWLFAIMHNLWASEQRRPRLPLRQLETADLDFPTRATQGDQLALADLASALQQLPEDQQAVLLLVSLEDMSYAEVAQTLGVPQGTVMSRISRARQRLRELLDNTPPPARLRVVR